MIILVDAIRDAECIEVLYKGLYEAAHKRLKRVYARVSSRSRTATNEMVERYNGETIHERLTQEKIKHIFQIFVSCIQCNMKVARWSVLVVAPIQPS